MLAINPIINTQSHLSANRTSFKGKEKAFETLEKAGNAIEQTGKAIVEQTTELSPAEIKAELAAMMADYGKSIAGIFG